jgi:hypothetical protein
MAVMAMAEEDARHANNIFNGMGFIVHAVTIGPG